MCTQRYSLVGFLTGAATVTRHGMSDCQGIPLSSLPAPVTEESCLLAPPSPG